MISLKTRSARIGILENRRISGKLRVLMIPAVKYFQISKYDHDALIILNFDIQNFRRTQNSMRI